MSIIDQPWSRVVMPGTVVLDRKSRSQVFVTIEWQFERNQKWELSMTAVEGPRDSGNADGGAGQCKDWATVPTFRPASNWTMPDVRHLLEVWDRWHLNGMRAGSPAQEAWLRAHPVTATYPESHYDKAKAALAAVGLEPDPNFNHPTKVAYRPRIQGDPAEEVKVPEPVPYSYGSAWLYEPVPAEVLQWLYDRPRAIKPHPWGDSDYERED